MGAKGSRRLCCFILFALIGWALVGKPSRSSSCTRQLLSALLCGIFGLCLAKLSELHPLPKEVPSADLPQPPPAPIMAIEVPTAYCSICMESKPLSHTFSIDSCSHSFCKGCIRLYVAARMSDNSSSFSCPEPGCKDGMLALETCRRIVAPEVLDRWERALCEKAIGAKFYCPFKDCSALLADDRADRSAIKEAECPHCHRLFCAQCDVPWHTGVSCKEYMKLGKHERAPGDLLVMKMAKNQKWQRCAKCKFYVERAEGCMFMKCRCGFKFCYRCGTKTVKDHYCNKCKC